MQIKRDFFVKLLLFVFLILAWGGINTTEVRANWAEPCKMCDKTTCAVVASGTKCMDSLNECNKNSDCGGVNVCTPACGCASSTCNGSTCGDGCGGKCNGTKNCCVTNNGPYCSNGNTYKYNGCKYVKDVTCTYGCDAGGIVCKTVSPYCEDSCNNCGVTKSGTAGNNLIDCWTSLDAKNHNTGKLPSECVYNSRCSYSTCPSGETMTSTGCCANAYVTSTNTCCHPSSDTCGGSATCTAPQVSHLDNCGGLGCGAACTGGGGGGGGGSTCTNPDVPTPMSPVSGVEVTAADANITWTEPASWGNEGSGGSSRSYSLCASPNASNPCSTGGWTASVASPATSTPFVPTMGGGTYYWQIKSNNTCSLPSPWSAVNSFCYEGFNSLDAAYVSDWSACDLNTHKRTRTCTEDCGTNNCASVPLEEDCLGSVRGTLFDASNLSACPSFDPVTGYLTGLTAGTEIANQSFGFTDQNLVAPHPWTLLSTPTTDANGNYSIDLYAPATYVYDFSSLAGSFEVSSGPKLSCTPSGTAVVPDNDPTCNTQPCSEVTNMSFGFNRHWNGWWQVSGGNVHGELGIKSSIPANLPTEQSLILPESSEGNRRGVLSYGALVSEMLGVNTNAKVSTSLWQVLSNYNGVIYDYDYFNLLFKKYATTTWNGSSGISYDDGGKGYEIVKVAGPVANLTFNPIGTQKIIFLVDGNVTVGANIVVPVGAYMAVIASGDISFATNVTRVDGWYLADNINVRCKDLNVDLVCDKTDSQFLGNGSFVGWQGINLTRDRDGVLNAAGPSELFTYRLDLYENAPEVMKNTVKKYKPYVP